MPAVSTTFFAHLSIHSGKSAISLYLKNLPYQPRLARNQFQVGNLDPTHASLRSNRDHDYYFRLLREEERDAQSIARCSNCTPWRFASCPAFEPNFFNCS